MGEEMGGLTWMRVGAQQGTCSPYFCGTGCAQTLTAGTKPRPPQSTALVQLQGSADRVSHPRDAPAALLPQVSFILLPASRNISASPPNPPKRALAEMKGQLACTNHPRGGR